MWKLRAACWLHDTIDAKLTTQTSKHSEVEHSLRDNDATERQIDEILYIIQNLSLLKTLIKNKT